MFSSIGAGGFLLIVIVALLLFGPSKLPELGRAFGKTLREFKNGTKDIISDEEESAPPPTRKEVNASHSEKPAESRKLPD